MAIIFTKKISESNIFYVLFMGFDGLLTCVTEFTEEKHDLQETQTLLNFEDWLIILNNDGLKSGSGYFIYLNMYTINYINLTRNIVIEIILATQNGR